MSRCSVLPLAALALAGCGSESRSDYAYRYEHVEKIAGDYAAVILEEARSDVENQALLFDAGSKANKLALEFGEGLADYFVVELEEKIFEVDPALADSLFGYSAPKSVFLSTR